MSMFYDIKILSVKFMYSVSGYIMNPAGYIKFWFLFRNCSHIALCVRNLGHLTKGADLVPRCHVTD